MYPEGFPSNGELLFGTFGKSTKTRLDINHIIYLQQIHLHVFSSETARGEIAAVLGQAQQSPNV